MQIIKEKESSPGNNVKLNPLYNIKSLKPEFKIEININFFKKPNEYISNEYLNENTVNCNSYTYNKDYLRSIEKLSKIFHKNTKISPPLPPIQLQNYTVIFK